MLYEFVCTFDTNFVIIKLIHKYLIKSFNISQGSEDARPFRITTHETLPSWPSSGSRRSPEVNIQH